MHVVSYFIATGAMFYLFFYFQYLYSAFIKHPKHFYLNYMTRLRAIVKLHTKYD